MRKTTFLLTLLLGLLFSVGAKATVIQPVLTTDVNNPVLYVIKNFRSGNYATYNGANTKLGQSATISQAQMWYFLENGEGVSIVPYTAPTLKMATNSSATAAGAVWYLKENPYNEGYFCLSLTSDLSANCWDDNNGIGYWNPRSNDYEGTSWIIETCDFVPTIPADKVLSVGAKTNAIAVSQLAADNNHWYLVTQDRGGESPMYGEGVGTQLRRAASSVTPTALNGKSAISNAQYLVRFKDAGGGLYKIQFGNGRYVNASLNVTESMTDAGRFAFYNTVSEGTTFGWNKTGNEGAIQDRVDNNGAGNGLAFWGSGTVTATSGNNVWSVYPVEFVDGEGISYPFTTTDGAFFNKLTDNKAAADGNYCNLWLSKNAAYVPQLKLISNVAVSDGNSGNNMRSSGGLYTTDGNHQYNLSVSKGKIKSYTIVGTAVGALSITPAGGEAENFAASAAVSKKVTLGTPAKETNFTLSGSNQWLNVEKFIVEWESDVTVINSANEITNDGIYTLEPHNAERGTLYAGTTYLDACGGHANTNYPANKNMAIDAADPNQQFAIYTYNGQKYLYNIGRAKFAGEAEGLYYKLHTIPNNTWAISAGVYSNTIHLTSQADSKLLTINAWVNTGSADSKDYGVTGNDANEKANNLYITRVGTLTSEQLAQIEKAFTLMTSLNEIEQYTIGTAIHEFTNASFTNEAAKTAYISNIRTNADGFSASELALAATSAESILSAMTINSVPTNAFYRIKGVTNNKYLAAGTTNGKYSMSDATDATTIFYYDGNNKLTNLSSGMCNGVHQGSWNWVTQDQASTVTFLDGHTYGGYGIRSNNVYFYDNNTNADRGGNIDLSSGDVRYRSWRLEEITSLPITISAALYASLNLPVAVTRPTGVKAYVGTNNGTTIRLTEITDGIIKANTAVILTADAAGTYNFDITTGGTEDSDLQGTVGAETISAPTVYTLQNGTNGIAFYALDSKTVPGFKAYLASSSSVRSLTFDFGGATAIDSKLIEQTGATIYDLSGRRVEKAQKGLYIMNGKKVLVK